MRTVLICQHDAPLAHTGMARWLASWSDLTGMIVLHDSPGGRWKRITRQARRTGWLRMADIAAFRLYQRLFLDAADRQFAKRKLAELCEKYPPLPPNVPRREAASPNTAACVEFLKTAAPDIVIAACKHILKPKVFSIPTTGAFALHPGICPEYRNAHGCFWALANDDVENVGTTLLKIDAGIDTGPVYGYFRGPYDEVHESHAVIQRRMTLDHLDEIADTLCDVHAGIAKRIDVAGRTSAEWGQPWLSAYLRWKRHARQRASRPRDALVLAGLPTEPEHPTEGLPNAHHA
jgi:hypothetical protein